MYTVPWIIENMILNSNETTTPRRPSEAELKVQKSLQQLTVPDWYANKCVASPKIIVDRRPFESRPAPWKDPVRNRVHLNEPLKNSMTNAASVKPAVEQKKTPDLKMEKLNQGTEEFIVKPSPSYSSKTFPKMSPSRKIQNINIVFPRPTRSPGKLVESKKDRVFLETNFFDDRMMNIDSMTKFTPEKKSNLENEQTPMAVSTPNQTSTVRESDFQETPEISQMDYSYSAIPKTPPNTPVKEKNQIISSLLKFSDTEKKLVDAVKRTENTELMTPKKTTNILKMNSPVTPVPFTPPKTLDKTRPRKEEGLFTSPKKSMEMESIIQSERRRSPSRSFVEEIIQELNAKCSPKVKSNYVSPTSKNFVKKLVQALEMGYIPKRDDEDVISESCIDLEFKPEPLSASISIKDSDSGSGSDTESKLSTSQSTFSSFSRALENGGRMSRESIIPYVDDENESVFWIPLPMCRMPRTSSLKSIVSNLPSEGGRSSSTSPIPDSGPSQESVPPRPPSRLHMYPETSGWGKTFDKKQSQFGRLFRIEETPVIDSGYSDRSRTNSSSSSITDESWYGDSETTQTASEIGDEHEDAYSGVVKPRPIPSSKQSTFKL